MGWDNQLCVRASSVLYTIDTFDRRNLLPVTFPFLAIFSISEHRANQTIPKESSEQVNHC